MAHKTDDEHIQKTHNTERFFVEHPHITWVLLIATLIWGVYGYTVNAAAQGPGHPGARGPDHLPLAGDDHRQGGAVGHPHHRTEGRRKHPHQEDRVHQPGGPLRDYGGIGYKVADTDKQFDDIKYRLDSIHDLPEGAGPIQFFKDYGNTAALMLTVASPKVSEVEIALRARDIEKAIRQVRQQAHTEPEERRVTLVIGFPISIIPRMVHPPVDQFAAYIQKAGLARDVRLIEGPGFVGIDAATTASDAQIMACLNRFIREHLRASELHPDVWEPVLIHDPAETASVLAQHPGDKYSYREMDHFTKLIERTLLGVTVALDKTPIVTKVSRSGVLDEVVWMEYSQERLASYGGNVTKLPDILKARNIAVPGGVVEVEGKEVTVQPSGEFKSAKEIGNVMMAATANGVPVYLRDVAEIYRGYESPPQISEFYLLAGRSGDIGTAPGPLPWRCRCAPGKRSACSERR